MLEQINQLADGTPRSELGGDFLGSAVRKRQIQVFRGCGSEGAAMNQDHWIAIRKAGHRLDDQQINI